MHVLGKTLLLVSMIVALVGAMPVDDGKLEADSA